jgi:phosphoglycolate phosphatase
MKTGKINTVIFDLDGTLLDTLDDLADAVNYSLSQFQMPLKTREHVKSYVGNGIRQLMIRAVPNGEENPEFERAFDTFKEYYGDHCNVKTKAYSGINEMLRELSRQGVKLAIVSNKVDSAVKELKDRYFGDVDVAIGDREGLPRKPAPDSVLMALNELGSTIENAVYVGDSDVDIKTAGNAGLPCISVLWGFRDRKFLEENGADIFAETPLDILHILEAM